jgi:hypothetical protein
MVMCSGSGFGVEGSVFKVQVWGLGFKVQDLGFWGGGLRVYGPG